MVMTLPITDKYATCTHILLIETAKWCKMLDYYYRYLDHYYHYHSHKCRLAEILRGMSSLSAEGMMTWGTAGTDCSAQGIGLGKEREQLSRSGEYCKLTLRALGKNPSRSHFFCFCGAMKCILGHKNVWNRLIIGVLHTTYLEPGGLVAGWAQAPKYWGPTKLAPTTIC